MTEPKIVIFDLETLPDLKESLKVWPQLSQYPGKTLRASITSIICAGYKLYGEKKTHCINAWDFPEWRKDQNNDKKLCKAIYEVLKDADAVVTHNGKRFDWKYLQTRLLKHDLPPLGKIPHIDTKALCSQHLFSFNNRLGYVGDWLVDDKKLDHEGWDLWVKTWHRDPKAMAKMEKYCKQDVDLLEKVFVKLKPLIGNMPNYNLWSNITEKVCPNCGSTRLNSNGYRHTKTRSYKRLICADCRTWSRVDANDNNPRSL